MQKNKVPGTETVKLAFPIEHGGKQIDEITLRRPKVGDMLIARKARGDDAEQELALFASLSDLPPDALRHLDMKDYGQLQEVYKGFLS